MEHSRYSGFVFSVPRHFGFVKNGQHFPLFRVKDSEIAVIRRSYGEVMENHFAWAAIPLVWRHREQSIWKKGKTKRLQVSPCLEPKIQRLR